MYQQTHEQHNRRQYHHNQGTPLAQQQVPSAASGVDQRPVEVRPTDNTRKQDSPLIPTADRQKAFHFKNRASRFPVHVMARRHLTASNASCGRGFSAVSSLQTRGGFQSA